MEKKIIQLEELQGKHELSGLDSFTNKYHESGYRFVLDGVTYSIKEDKDDGYRSYCGDLTVSKDKVKFNFPPQSVVAEISKSSEEGRENVLNFYDAVTSKLVLTIGTVYYDSYYPCCTMGWFPENLFINQSATTQKSSK